jgi:hypothetical protein
VFDGVGHDLGKHCPVVDGEVEAHPGRRGEYVCGISGGDGPACPVAVGDGGGHREGADAGDLDG